MTMNSLTQTSAPNMTSTTSVSPLEQSGSTNTKFSKSKSKTDIYQTVTDSIIEALESGVKPWVCPWVRQGQVSGLPSNLTTGNAYNGINIMGTVANRIVKLSFSAQSGLKSEYSIHEAHFF